MDRVPGNDKEWGNITPLDELDVDWEAVEHFILSPEGRKIIEREQWVYKYIQYNWATFPEKAFYDIFYQLKEQFFDKREEIGVDTSIPHMMQGWVNIFEQGDNIGWHSHCGDVSPHMFHGVIVVNPQGDSYTEYRDNNGDIIHTIPSKKGEGHIISDMLTEHRSSPNESEHPRITLAFDILGFDNWNCNWDNDIGNQYVPFC